MNGKTYSPPVRKTLLPSGLLAGIRAHVQRTDSESIVKAVDVKRQPKMVFISKHIRSSLKRSQSDSIKSSSSDTYRSNGQLKTLSNGNISSGDAVSQKESETSFSSSSTSLPEFSPPSTPNGSPALDSSNSPVSNASSSYEPRFSIPPTPMPEVLPPHDSEPPPPPVPDTPPPPLTPPPIRHQRTRSTNSLSEEDNETAPPPLPTSPPPPLIPPPITTELLLRTSSLNVHPAASVPFSLPEKEYHSAPLEGKSQPQKIFSPVLLPTRYRPPTPPPHLTSRQPLFVPTPSPETAPPPSESESDLSPDLREVDETLRFFNRTVSGENFISSDNSSSQTNDFHPLSLPKEDYFSTQGIDGEQNKGDNSDSSINSPLFGVTKWSEKAKTMRAAIRPGTVDELKKLFIRLGEDNFKPSLIKKKRKDIRGAKKSKKMKKYQRVIQMFKDSSSDEDQGGKQLTSGERESKVFKFPSNVEALDIQITAKDTDETQFSKRKSYESECGGNNSATGSSSNLYIDSLTKPIEADNQKLGHIPTSELIALMNKRLELNTKPSFKKDEVKDGCVEKEDDSKRRASGDTSVRAAPEFEFTADHRDSSNGSLSEVNLIDGVRAPKPVKQLDSTRINKSISLDHVTSLQDANIGELTLQKSSAGEVLHSFQNERISSDAQGTATFPINIQDSSTLEKVEALKKNPSVSAERVGDVIVTGQKLPDGKFFVEVSRSTSEPVLSSFGRNFSLVDDTPSDVNMSASVGELSSFDIHTAVSNFSRTYSSESGNLDEEKNTGGMFVVRDNVGDLYVVEDITDTTHATTTIEHASVSDSLENEKCDTSQTVNTTRSSIGSFDFSGIESGKASVDSSDMNYDKAKEVISALFSSRSSDKGLSVTEYNNDSLNRSNVNFEGTSVTSEYDMGSTKARADNQTSVTVKDDRGPSLHEDIYKKTILNIVTDEQDRHMWTEKTTDTETRTWLESNGETGVGDGGSNTYRSSVTFNTGKAIEDQKENYPIPMPDYPAVETSSPGEGIVITKSSLDQSDNISTPDPDYHLPAVRSVSNTSDLSTASVQKSSDAEYKKEVTVTTTTSATVNKKVDVFAEVLPTSQTMSESVYTPQRSIYIPEKSANVTSVRSRAVNTDGTDRQNVDDFSSISSDEGVKAYNVVTTKKTLGKRDSTNSAPDRTYVTRISSQMQSNNYSSSVGGPTYYAPSETMTTKIETRKRPSYGDEDSQYGSQTSKGTSGDVSPIVDDTPRYKVVRAEMSPTPTTPHKRTIFREVEQRPSSTSYYKQELFRSEQTVNTDDDLWRANSISRSEPRLDNTSKKSVILHKTHDPRDDLDRQKPERFRVVKTISADDLHRTTRSKRMSSGFKSGSDSDSEHGDKRMYKTVTKLEIKNQSREQTTPRKRRRGPRDSSDSENENSRHCSSVYRVSNVDKGSSRDKRRQEEETEEKGGQVYRVLSVTPSERPSRTTDKRVIHRHVNGRHRSGTLGSTSSEDEQQTGNQHRYKVGKTESTEDLIITRKKTTVESKGSTYRTGTSPTRFDSGYFDESVTSPRKPISPSHTTVIKLDPGSKRTKPFQTSPTRDSMYRVVNVKSDDNRTDRNMWKSKRRSPSRYSSDSDSDDDRKGKYSLMSSKYGRTSPVREYSSPEVDRRSRKEKNTYYVQRSFSPTPVDENVKLQRVRSLSPTPTYRVSSPTEWHKSSVDINKNYTIGYEGKRSSPSYFTTTPTNESKSYAVFTSDHDRGKSPQRTDSQTYKTEKTFYLKSTTPSTPNSGNYFSQRSYSKDHTVDSGTGTEIVSSDNEGNGDIVRERRYERVEKLYEFRQEAHRSVDAEDLEGDMKVQRGKILIQNKIDTSKDEDDFDDNVNVFAPAFHLQKDNPLYQSDPDIYKQLEMEEEEEYRDQDDFQKEVTQDITFDTVDRIAHKHTGSRGQVSLSPAPVRKQNLSALLLSKLANIDSKDVQQHIDVEHHNEEIYGDIDFVHADGTKSGSTNTDNFDAVDENVAMTLRDGKAFVIIKVIAERIVPIDYEFNVWRKSSAIVTRQIEIDLLANEQRRRLYKHVMESAGTSGAIEGGAYGPHPMNTSSVTMSEKQLTGMETLRLFSQILTVAEGQGDNDATEYVTHQRQGRLPSTHDILY